MRWAVARIGERELSGAGSASEQAQFVQKPNGFTNTVSSVVRCSLRDFSFSNPARINFVSRCELAFEFADGLLKRGSLHWLGWPTEREQTVHCHCVDADSVRLISGEQRDGVSVCEDRKSDVSRSRVWISAREDGDCAVSKFCGQGPP